MHIPDKDTERPSIQRYTFGILGIAAVLVMIGVSMSLNYRFGYSLGRSDIDGLIYGAASVAADAIKCLMPFAFFAAIRSGLWSQAAAGLLVWAITTAYALTGAFGHAALNRTDSAAKRMVSSTAYSDLRADLKRATDQLAWIPQHRPAATVEAEIETQKTQRMWTWTGGCNAAQTNSTAARTFCANVHKLEAERASAQEAAKIEARVADITGKLAAYTNGAPTTGDPQTAMLSRLTGVQAEDVAMGLSILLVLLLEVVSGFGLYTVMSFFPDTTGRKRKPVAVTHHQDVPIALPANENVLPFPSPQRETAALEAAPAMETPAAPVLETVSEVPLPGTQFTKEQAELDLHCLMANDGIVPSQQRLVERWGVSKGTVSKWLNSWPWVMRERNGIYSVLMMEAPERAAA